MSEPCYVCKDCQRKVDELVKKADDQICELMNEAGQLRVKLKESEARGEELKKENDALKSNDVIASPYRHLACTAIIEAKDSELLAAREREKELLAVLEKSGCIYASGYECFRNPSYEKCPPCEALASRGEKK